MAPQNYENLSVNYGGIVVDKRLVKNYEQVLNADGSKSEMHQLILKSGAKITYPTQINGSIGEQYSYIHMDNLNNASIFTNNCTRGIHLRGTSCYVNSLDNVRQNIIIRGDNSNIYANSDDQYRVFDSKGWKNAGNY